MTGVYKWCCETVGCGRKNHAEESQLTGPQKPLLVCRACGNVYRFVQKGTPRGTNYLECVQFKGPEKKFPTGRNDDGTFKDYQNSEKNWSNDEFIITFGLDARRYYEWLDAGKPKPRPDLRC